MYGLVVVVLFISHSLRHHLARTLYELLLPHFGSSMKINWLGATRCWYVRNAGNTAASRLCLWFHHPFLHIAALYRRLNDFLIYLAINTVV